MTYEIDHIEIVRQECANRINPYMERSEKKAFADYVMERQHVFDDAMQQAWLDLYQNFLVDEDTAYENDWAKAVKRSGVEI